MRKDIKDLTSIKSDEIKWFFEFFRNTHVNNKFNPGQKVNFLVTLFLITGLSLSGFVIWMKSMFNVGFVELNFMVHDFLAELSLIIISGHIIFALYHNESIHGIIYGVVDEDGQGSITLNGGKKQSDTIFPPGFY